MQGASRTRAVQSLSAVKLEQQLGFSIFQLGTHCRGTGRNKYQPQYSYPKTDYIRVTHEAGKAICNEEHKGQSIPPRDTRRRLEPSRRRQRAIREDEN